MSVIICGVGNILMRDDGLGCWVIRELKNYIKDKGIEVVDFGLGSLSCLLEASEYKKVILIDAIDCQPQEIFFERIKIERKKRYSIDDIQNLCSISLHRINPNLIVEFLSLIGKTEELIIIGTKPKDIRPQIGLSDNVRKKIPQIIDKIITYLEEVTKDG